MSALRIDWENIIAKPLWIHASLSWEGCRRLESVPGVSVEYDGKGNPVSVTLPADAAITVTLPNRRTSTRQHPSNPETPS